MRLSWDAVLALALPRSVQCVTGEVAVDLRFGQLLLTGGSALRATRWAYRQGVAESRFCVAAENMLPNVQRVRLAGGLTSQVYSGKRSPEQRDFVQLPWDAVLALALPRSVQCVTGEVAVDLGVGQLLPTGGSALRATRWAYRQGVAESRFYVAAQNTAAKRATRAAGRWAHQSSLVRETFSGAA